MIRLLGMRGGGRTFKGSIYAPRAMVMLFVLLLLLQTMPIALGQYQGEKVQLLEGRIDIDGIDSYFLPNMTVDNTLFVYMNGTSGNLDPFMGLTYSNVSLEDIVKTFEENIIKAIEEGKDYQIAIAETADELFLAWDDDSGWGYAATFGWNITQDGDYKLLVAGAPLRNTFGDYSLLIGLNAPEVLNGTADPTGDIIAVLDPEESQGRKGVQEVYGNLTADRASTVFFMNDVICGDVFYLFIETTSEIEAPRVILYDYGGKELRTVNQSSDRSNGTMSYRFDSGGCNYRLEVIGSFTGNITSGSFRLLVGFNEQQVLSGNASVGGRTVLKTSIPVRVGVELDQITAVDQKSENYAIVANIWMQWNDPLLAFSPDVCQCEFKIFRSIEEFVAEYGDLWPDFTLYNQQGNRWTQNQYFVVYPNGTATYFERFWVTLQAPDFDFRNFPFDHQQFYVRILCMYREEVYHYIAWDEKNSVGEQLGEEEWMVTSYSTNVTSLKVNDYNSLFSFGFVAERHISFYLVRFFMPILIILGLTWITWFVRDYSKRITIAAGNLLLFIAFSFTIGDDLPRLGYLTTMDKILISTFIWTALVVTYNFYMSRLTEKRRDELSLKIDKVLVWGFPFAFILTYLLISYLFP
jgi:hypothetical protein